MSQHQLLGPTMRKAATSLVRRLHLLVGEAGLVQKGRPEIGQRDVARAAVEEVAAERPLEPAHRLADGRLGEMQPFGCVPEVQGVTYRQEALQLAQVHSPSPDSPANRA